MISRSASLRALAAILSCSAFLELAGPARADDGPDALIAPADSASASDAVQRALADAVVEYDAGRYPEALALLERAHAMEPTARTSRAIGMAAFELRRYVVAVRALRDALAAAARPLTDAQRAHAEALLARAETFVARVRPIVEPRDAELRVDGERVAQEPDGAWMLEAGRHVVSAAHPEHDPVVVEVVLDAGRETEVALRLPRTSVGDEVPAAEGRDEETLLPSTATTAGPGLSPLLVTGVGLGLVATVTTAVAVTTGMFAMSSRDVLAAGCDPFFCPPELRPVRDQARSLALTADGLGVTGAVLGVAGIALTVLGAALESPSERGDGAPRAALACSDTGCAASVSGSF